MLRILIADDHEVVRQGLEKILRREYPDARIVAVADGEQLIAKAQDSEWDLVISDLSMPSTGGLDALARIRERQPELPVLILTMYPEEQYATGPQGRGGGIPDKGHGLCRTPDRDPARPH